MKGRLAGIFLIAMIFLYGNGHAQARQKLVQSKFVYETSLGFSYGLGDISYEETSVPNQMSSFSIHQLLAYQFNPYVQTGIGTGIDIWKKTAFIPVFANLTINMIDKRIAPRWYFNIGYSFKWYESMLPQTEARVIHASTPGIYGETGLGMKIAFTDDYALIITAAYTLQQSKIKYSVVQPGEVDFSQYSTNRSQDALYHFVGIKVAFFY